jgi:glycosyltransferase involved in cell wall biosynthesis
VLRHDYPVTLEIFRLLREASPDCVVISGWSTFASQAALAWSRVHHVPYVLLVESHDHGPKRGWRRTVKQTVVPPIVRGAASVLVVGWLARESVLSLGAVSERIRVFENTVDVSAFSDRARMSASRRQSLRAGFDLSASDFVVVSVARLAPEKGLDTLIQAGARLREKGLVLLLVGDGPERERLERLVGDLGVRAVFAGERPWESVVDAYVVADAFALLSDRETWGVVVNEAAACGLPLVLSDRVGAAPDLLRDGENGFLVPARDVTATAEALERLAGDLDQRLRMGARSREIADGHGYEVSVDNLIAAVLEATGKLTT